MWLENSNQNLLDAHLDVMQVSAPQPPAGRRAAHGAVGPLNLELDQEHKTQILEWYQKRKN